MGKKTIRLTENDLRGIIKEAVKRALNEMERSRPGDLPPGDEDVHYPGDINPDVWDALQRGDFGDDDKDKMKIGESMGFNRGILEDDLRNYFSLDKEYDGSVSMANARERLLNACCGDLPWGVNGHKFLNMIYSLPGSWSVDSLVERALDWVEANQR